MSTIEWTEETWNPIAGCSVHTPGCTNCYAMKMAARLEAIALAALARLAHGTGLVPKAPERDVLAEALELTQMHYSSEEDADALRAELAKHNYAVVKVATDEERLIEARELCAGVIAGWGCLVFSDNYREGLYDHRPEMIAHLAALKARDGVA